MIFIWFAVFLCFVGAGGQTAGAAKNQTDSWSEFISKEAGFKILFPATPKISTEVVMKTPIERVNTRFEVSLNRGYFAVHYSDHPLLPDFDKKSLRANYESLKKNVAKTTNAEIIREKEIYAGSNLGNEVVFKLKDEAIVVRFFLIDKRLYQNIISISYSDLEKQEMQKEISKFFDSFELINSEGKK